LNALTALGVSILVGSLIFLSLSRSPRDIRLSGIMVLISLVTTGMGATSSLIDIDLEELTADLGRITSMSREKVAQHEAGHGFIAEYLMPESLKKMEAFEEGYKYVPEMGMETPGYIEYDPVTYYVREEGMEITELRKNRNFHKDQIKVGVAGVKATNVIRDEDDSLYIYQSDYEDVRAHLGEIYNHDRRDNSSSKRWNQLPESEKESIYNEVVPPIKEEVEEIIIENEETVVEIGEELFEENKLTGEEAREIIDTAEENELP